MNNKVEFWKLLEAQDIQENYDFLLSLSEKEAISYLEFVEKELNYLEEMGELRDKRRHIVYQNRIDDLKNLLNMLLTGDSDPSGKSSSG